jgi:hypothetical protein
LYVCDDVSLIALYIARHLRSKILSLRRVRNRCRCLQVLAYEYASRAGSRSGVAHLLAVIIK